MAIGTAVVADHSLEPCLGIYYLFWGITFLIKMTQREGRGWGMGEEGRIGAAGYHQQR